MIASEEAQPDAAQQMLRKAIMAIHSDQTLSAAEKAQKTQQLMSGSWKPAGAEAAKAEGASKGKAGSSGASGSAAPAADEEHPVAEHLSCAICMNLCERPVTAPCQHNFCLACFNKWVQQSKRTCPTCRTEFPTKFAQNPRINTALIVAIRLAKNPIKAKGPGDRENKRVEKEQRPDEAFVTERAVRAGRANAASGRIMVTISNDHFGPIGPEHDPRGQGVQVGEFWKDRLDCRQWGAHFPHVAGIAGQSNVGAQSVVLSGGYEDDKDEGEWFLYTGSGGRDLSGNKRTNKVQSFDQEFTSYNKALQLSCTLGLPVRVVRSYKEKRSAYAPSTECPVRYDGIYRILRCWRKPGIQKQLVCRYLFVRADNSPAPWTSDESGDSVRLDIPEEAGKEIKQAKGQVFAMSAEPYWDWIASEGKWGWTRPSPTANKPPGAARGPVNHLKKARTLLSEHERALKQFRCSLCKDTLKDPLVTPCGHNFCKSCLEGKFAGIADIEAPNAARTLRIRRVLKPCPTCKADVCEFLATAQVNRALGESIADVQAKVEKARAEAARIEAAAAQEEAGGAEGQEGEEEAGGSAQEEDEEGEQQAEDDDEQAAAEEEEGDDDEQQQQGGSSRSQKGAAAGVQAQQEHPVAAGGSGAGPSGSREDAAAEPAQGQQAASSDAPAAAKPYRYAVQLATLRDKFPVLDEASMRDILDDQDGDMIDAVGICRKLAAAMKPKAPAALRNTNSNKKSKAGGAAAKRKGGASSSNAEQQGTEDDAADAGAAPCVDAAGKGSAAAADEDEEMADKQEQQNEEEKGAQKAAPKGRKRTSGSAGASSGSKKARKA